MRGLKGVLAIVAVVMEMLNGRLGVGKAALMAVGCLLAATSLLAADPLFSENFEGDLSQWTGRGGGSHHGQIVADPLRPENKVVTFNAMINSGDMFSTSAVSLVQGQSYVFSLDYLGLEVPGVSVPDDFGGFAGLSNGLNAWYPDRWLWVFGTQADYPIPLPVHLIDNGQWSHYEFPFVWDRSMLMGDNTSDTVHLMLEDNTSGGTAGDAYFDNLVLSQVVPEPSALALLGVGAIGLLGWAWRRRWRRKGEEERGSGTIVLGFLVRAASATKLGPKIRWKLGQRVW